MILVSACLAGQCTRYDGRHSLDAGLMQKLQSSGVPYLALCPEVLGGLAIPRPPARLQGARAGREGDDVIAGRARLVTSQGGDVTAQFVKGARLAAEIARKAGVAKAFLKDRSPSCGWDPKGRNPEGGPGRGVLAALLDQMGIELIEVRARAQGGLRPK